MPVMAYTYGEFHAEKYNNVQPACADNERLT